MDDELAALMGQLSRISVTSPGELRTKFASVLGISEAEAGFFLDSANGNIELAVNIFLETRDSEAGMGSTPGALEGFSPTPSDDMDFDDEFAAFLTSNPAATPEAIEAFRAQLLSRGFGTSMGPPTAFPSRPTVTGPGFGQRAPFAAPAPVSAVPAGPPIGGFGLPMAAPPGAPGPFSGGFVGFSALAAQPTPGSALPFALPFQQPPGAASGFGIAPYFPPGPPSGGKPPSSGGSGDMAEE